MLMDWLFNISRAVAETGAAVAEGEVSPAATLLGSFVPLILIVVVFYFFLIRPQRKKDKKAKEMLKALKVGDRICTIGGIYGTITGIRDDTLILSVSQKNTELVIARWAVRNVEEVSVENDAEALV